MNELCFNIGSSFRSLTQPSGFAHGTSREAMQSRSEPENIYIATEEQSGDGNHCVGFFQRHASA